jgi:2-iminobutanoate/2-iminopropanoate deaminase
MKRIIHTDKAPEAIGPYNQAVESGDTIYVSGQIAIDPESGDLQSDDIATETHQVLQNLQAILEASGSSLANILHCTIYVKNIDDYDKINDVYSHYFPSDLAPARALVEVSRLPKNVNVEMTVIAEKL